MFLSIASNSRRDMLKMALHQFIETTQRDADPDSCVTYDEMQRASIMVAEAKHMLRQIAATETLMLHQPHLSTATSQED